MKYVIVVCAALLISTPSFGASKPCEELKSDIEAKIQAKGVKDYKLEVIPNDQVKDGKVIGTCEGGTKKIIYKKEK